MSPQRSGILLINLGTPDAPNAAAVGRYLREFLMDPYVLRIPWLLRWFLVNILILPNRRHASAALYRKVWTPAGSPLLVECQALKQAMQQALPEARVALAMRYGEPSITEGLRTLLEQGVTSIRVVPLYPHYALSSVETCIRATERSFRQLKTDIPIDVINPFYEDKGYIAALVATIAEAQSSFPSDHILFSFHGIPVSHVTATDPKSDHCYKRPDCCEHFRISSPDCYRAQCFATAKAAAKVLNLNPDQYTVSFQSRLGREPWLKPYTDHVINEFPSRGIKRLLVASPSFTADCLETLEEIAQRAAEDFHAHGGEALRLVPSLNSRAPWIEALVHLITDGPRRPLTRPS